ncbi:hypothetical protein MSIMFI_05581 [Mycobacterium simulans]|nr:hypothetical protein MSIMFI_05581 [Mycobacterium simulans]
MRQRPGRVEPIHHRLKRHVLMLKSRHAARPHLGQQLSNTGITEHLDPQYQRVDEKAHQLIQCGIAPTGDWDPHCHIRTGADLRQQHAQGGLDHHEAGRMMLAGHPRYLLLQIYRPIDVNSGAPIVSHRRIRPIGGYLYTFGHPRQCVLPVLQLGGHTAVGIGQITQMLALPQRVIDVLHRQLRPLRSMPSAPTGVSHTQIRGQRGQRPAISGDVMHSEHQHILLLTNDEKLCSKRDFGRQVERVARRCGHRFIESSPRPPARVDNTPPHLCLLSRHHHLLGYPLDRRKDRAQAFMTAHHINQRLSQRCNVKLTTQPQHHRHVVNRGGPLKLINKPQPTLGKRQRNHRRAPIHRRQRRTRATTNSDITHQLTHRGRIKQRAHT